METESGRAQQSSYIGSQSSGSISHAEENAYIKGYLALTLYIIEQVVHDGKKNHILVSMSILGYLLRDKEVARTFPELVVHQAGITISTLDRRAQRFGHASGSSAPSMMFPTPSMTLYVGSCFPPEETELKKWGLGVIGDCEVGSKPWPSGKERGAVVHKLLRNMRERANEEMARIICSEMKQSWARGGRAQVPQRGTNRSFRPGVIEVYLKSDVICISIRDLCLLCCCSALAGFCDSDISCVFAYLFLRLSQRPFQNPIQDKRPYLMLDEPSPSAVSITFLSPPWSSTSPRHRGLSSRSSFRPAWLCSFPF